ncbi:uncharacterized protein (DUF4415 family) [Bradyrhizobium sp. LM3.4]
MNDSLEVEVLYPGLMAARISEAQGRHREVGSEDSVEQKPRPDGQAPKSPARTGLLCLRSGPAATKVAVAPPKQNVAPGVKEQVTLRIDQDVLEHFQAGGPGWQDRINDALRKAAGK